MKIRCKRYLYTLILKDSDKADKIKQSLPPSKFAKRERARTTKSWMRRQDFLWSSLRLYRHKNVLSRNWFIVFERVDNY